MAKKKGSNKEEEEVVLDYLTRANRPYSITDIFNNLHAKYSKTNITKALEKLVEDDLVLAKVYGKTTIYSVKQQLDAADNTEDLSKAINDLAEKCEALVGENRKLDSTLMTIKSEPTTSEATELVEQLKKENALLQERLNKLREGTELVPPEKRKRTNDEYDTYRQLWKKRRGMFRDIFRTVTEHLPGNPNELKETLGIEEDEIPFEQDPLVSS
ncbi:Tat binding protein 1-interacting protein-domain-containing protein [Pilaira anomala]|nr:Tat binding protein 1-interacting protein-domain-containing protein [Pilaira anomala]